MYALIYNNSSTKSPGCVVTNENVLVADVFQSLEAALDSFIHSDFFSSVNQDFELGIDIDSITINNAQEVWDDIVAAVDKARTSQLQAKDLIPVASSFFLMRWNKVQKTPEISIRNSTSVHIAFMESTTQKKKTPTKTKRTAKTKSPTKRSPTKTTMTLRSRKI